MKYIRIFVSTFPLKRCVHDAIWPCNVYWGIFHRIFQNILWQCQTVRWTHPKIKHICNACQRERARYIPIQFLKVKIQIKTIEIKPFAQYNFFSFGNNLDWFFSSNLFFKHEWNLDDLLSSDSKSNQLFDTKRNLVL